MEERKLNFNAPLLSVRRFSTTSAFSVRDKRKIIENSPHAQRHTLPFYDSDVSLDQVTEPVAVPFVWEQIPGKAKGSIDHEFQSNMGVSVTPRLPPWQVLNVRKYPVGTDIENQNVVRLQTETYSMSDHVTKLDCSNEGINEKCISESENNDDDVYSDALDTLSPTDSFSMNCGISSLSGLGGPVAKPSGTFSTDPQTQDFMMSRFLPAAKAMTLVKPQYALRKQSMGPEKPREVRKVADRDRKPPVNQYESIIISHYNKDVDEEETEDEYDDYEDSGNLSRQACGLLPRLCFKNSLCLLNPVPGLKVRTHSSMSSTREVVKPEKATYMKSQSQILEKHAWDVVHKKKSDSRVQYPFPESNSDSAVQSPWLPEDKSDIGVQFPRLPEIGKKLTCRSNRVISSNDQQIVNRSPPKRFPDSARISPYRRERPQSPFRAGGFLGMPKKEEKFKANMLVKYTRSNNNSQELVPYERTRQGSGSLSPAVEKTLYVDTVNFAEIASSNSNSSDTKVHIDSTGKHSYTLLVNRKLEEPDALESSLLDTKDLNLLDGKGISEYEITGSVNSSQSSFSDKPDLTGQAEMIDCFRQNGGPDQEAKSLERLKVRADAKLTLIDDDDLRAADQGESRAGSDYSPLPPPLPKTPSQSWLWSTLPSVTPRNSFSQFYNGSRFNPKKQIPIVDTKWETIVKTSYSHHDHIRYSEELVTHFSQQSKT